MSKRVLGFVGAVLLSIVGIGLLLAYVGSAEDRALEGEQLVEVYVVADAIDQGTVTADITDRVRLEQVPTKLRIEDAVVSLDEIDGLVASIDLRPGEQITRSRFVLAQSLTGYEGPTLDIPDTFVELTVSLTPSQAVGGTVVPGSNVSIFASFDPFDVNIPPLPDGTTPLIEVDGILIADSGSTPSATHVLFANVLVTNVQFDETPVTLNDDEESNLASAPTSALLVTVALSPSDAERLVFATTFGTLWFATEGSAVTADGTSIQTRGSIFSGRAPELVETLPAESAEEEG